MLGQKQRAYKAAAMVGMLIVGLGAVGTAVAQQPAGPPGATRQSESVLTPEDRAAMAQIYWHRVQNRLGLTDQQVADIRSLLQAQRTAARSDVQSLIASRRLLRTLLEQPTPDPSAIQAAATQVKGLQAKLIDDRLQAQLDLRSKLTPEQWQGWLSLRKGNGAPVDAARACLQVRRVGGPAR